ncbi:MAG: helix-turn-helix transcriptional regulator [Clostridiales bacterium]|nr:helix-turn-helix transcriptional regulator [Eubacteriales bacterium]MDH7567270.1 helix-turn-helix transcriptional regulator [Clostridiales bacterium]
MFKKEIGNRLRMARENANLTQGDVAKMINSTFQKISSFETGRTRVDLETLVKLCSIYDVEPDYVLGTKKNESGHIAVKPEEADILRKYRQLPDPVKEDIRDYIDMKYAKVTTATQKQENFLK